MATTTLNIQGMSCGGCVKSIENILNALDGVLQVQVSLEEAKVHIDYEAEKTNTVAFKIAIEDAGYEVIG